MRRGLYRLNSTVLSCRLNALNCITSRRYAGKLFHIRGSATEKLLSPKVLWVHGRKHVLSVYVCMYNIVRGYLALLLLNKYISSYRWSTTF